MEIKNLLLLVWYSHLLIPGTTAFFFFYQNSLDISQLKNFFFFRLWALKSILKNLIDPLKKKMFKKNIFFSLGIVCLLFIETSPESCIAFCIIFSAKTAVFIFLKVTSTKPCYWRRVSLYGSILANEWRREQRLRISPFCIPIGWLAVGSEVSIC